jgi:ADP-ribose pyrophosphatase YjhB (NUDIX family)
MRNNEKSMKCDSCGFVFYVNASAAVAAFIRNADGDLLVCTRGKEPAKGTLDLPGGFVDEHETAEEAVSRELKEELGALVTEVRYLFSLPNTYLYSDLSIPTLDMFFECRLQDYGQLKAADDVESIRFVSPENIDPEQFGLDSVRESVKRYLLSLKK